MFGLAIVQARSRFELAGFGGDGVISFVMVFCGRCRYGTLRNIRVAYDGPSLKGHRRAHGPRPWNRHRVRVVLEDTSAKENE